MRILCPHCGTVALIRDSHKITDLTRELRVICLDPECAHTWKVHVSAVLTLAPSMKPKKGVFIPLSTKSEAAKAAESAAPAQGSLFELPPPRLAAAGIG